ncbi:cysteine proteinase [Pseudovirgaria hyperparasitica]|uniref:Ubiquitin carboxyl-terminal hydrolase n=1 Tax=Pseudovirgaria hyperparasitica TaxID=470096 RepID=A0A6A6WGP7_9PEZI|nr:cysteine proteinase [Pseudovirgaria hyperparasitica]KAF2761254.1 cysteine proteinase [Pseudovirgaria hyperparasitica]
MPDKPLTIATYAAGASLAAITLVYVFGPTFFLDEESSSANRKKGVVGLSNPANDCFINANLQALAGLPELRLYLIRETHRRKLDGDVLYAVDPAGRYEDEHKREITPWKLEGLQKGVVTQGLKDVLDRLNERPIYKKTISAQSFIGILERAFQTRISRQQQDAQEFLQVVTERLCDEYHAGIKARRKAKKLNTGTSSAEKKEEDEDTKEVADSQSEVVLEKSTNQPDAFGKETEKHQEEDQEKNVEDDEEGFPFEGKMESIIECQTCHFRPKPSVSTFVTLTLSVPQKTSATLNNCFDGLMKVEHIDDYKCDYCRLDHALKSKRKLLSAVSTQEVKATIQSDIDKLEQALEKDPERPPEDVELPDSKLAPKTRIERHVRISEFPKILAIHLSRSLYSATTLSTKNMAKVTFPESLPLGGLLDQKRYRLLGTVTHKGGHNSGHYESFRRQITSPPYSTPHSFGQDGVYSIQPSPNPSIAASPYSTTPTLRPTNGTDVPPTSDPTTLPSPLSPVKSRDSTAPSSVSTRSSSTQQTPRPSASLTKESSDSAHPRVSESSLRPPTVTSLATSEPKTPSSKTPSIVDIKNLKPKSRKKQPLNRWWRISDEKIKECKTSEVLAMQKEVYLLFYELDKRTDEET